MVILLPDEVPSLTNQDNSNKQPKKYRKKTPLRIK